MNDPIPSFPFLPYLAMFLGALLYTVVCYAQAAAVADERKHGINPKSIAVVCMECNRRISGPRPGFARYVSHGLCNRCADAWKNKMISRPLPLSQPSVTHNQ